MKDGRIGWGIMAPGRIGREMAESLKLVPDGYVAATGSRSLERAEAFAGIYGGKAYGSYEELCADPDVDIIYVATPHPAHLEGVKTAAAAGKAILCEKPFSVNLGQTKEMLQAAYDNDIFLMEGLWSRFFPAWRYVSEVIASGRLGKVVNVHACTGWNLIPDYPKDGRLLNPELAGGSLLDGGVYSIASMIVSSGHREMPEELESIMTFTDTGVDDTTMMMLKYADGMTAQLTSGLHRSEHRSVIECEKGIIEIPRHRNPDTVIIRYEPTVGYAKFDWNVEEKHFPYQSFGFQYEAAVVQDCVRKGLKECPEVTHAETLFISELCDTVRGQNGFRYPFE